jgi:hypothetical protein
MPCISWGFGQTPVLKDRPHTLLAVAWGPLIQLMVLIDHEMTDQPFVQDGYHILINLDTQTQPVPLQLSESESEQQSEEMKVDE